MRRHRVGHALLAAIVLVPAGVSSCHKGHGSGGASPAGTSSEVTNADDGGSDDDDAATPTHSGGRDGRNKGHGKSADGSEAGAPAAPMAAIVINKPTPEPLAPPALRKLPALPELPNLPSPSKYPKASALPKAKDIEECGQVWSGEEYVPVECLDPGLQSKDARAAKVVIPYEKMQAASEVLPKMVDHRADGTEGPIRKQGGPQCTAFAFTSALDHAYARWTGTPANLSVMQIWARYHLKQERAAADSNVGDFIAAESDWPYDSKEANSWLRCRKEKPGVPCGKSPDDAKLKDLEPKAVAELTQIEVVPLTQLDVLREKIAGGQDVTVAIKLPSFATAGEAGAKYIVGIPKDKPETPPKGAHQILLSGYAMTPNGTYYLVHNSWGPKWGDGGYAWLHEDFLKAYWVDKIMVIPDVQPKQVAELRAHAHGHLTETCGEGKVPDSISGLCAAKCPDGSPRHNNVCARDAKDAKEGKHDKGGQCPAGMVNLIGECVLAAPKGSGKDDASKVRWDCGPGGCVYGIPKDKLDCKQKECEVSCPAPDFRLATTSKGLVCVE
jgi:Papain family cysteine protease